MKISKKQMTATFMTAILAGSIMASSVAIADVNNGMGSSEEQADITNWIANTPQQISKNMAMQHINTNNLNGIRYIIQWGDTLSGISSATGISVAKLCYDNNIQNANLIFAGNVLILNREGTVPADYHPDVNPYAVAQTKVTINNGPTNVNIAVQPHAIVNNYNEADNSDHSKTIYKAVGDNSSTGDQNNDSKSTDDQNEKSKSSTSDSDSIKTGEIVKGLEDANKNDNLAFDDDKPEDDAKKLDIDSDEILKDVKAKDYDALLDKIKDALDSKDEKDTTIDIYKDDDGEIAIYANVKDDSDDTSDSNNQEDKNSSTDDEDKNRSSDSHETDDEDNQSSTVNDEDTDNASDDE